MNKEKLAEELRNKQIKLGLVPKFLIDKLSDDAIINSYITCSKCGVKEADGDILEQLINKAQDTEDFFQMIQEIQQHEEQC